MDDTQALDFQLGSFPEEPQDADDVQIGSLMVSHADGKRETHPLYTGQNFVARRSAQSHKDEDKIQAWKRDSPGAALHGIFLESASVSSPHAIIYMEARGNFCFVKDLGSKNKTLMEGSTGSIVLQTGDRYAVHSGAAVNFGNIGCTIQYSAQPMGRPPAAEAPHEAAPSALMAMRAYDAVEANAAPQDSAAQLQSAQAAAAAAPEAAPAAAPLQAHLYDATQIEMGTPAAAVTQAAAATVPAQLLEALQLGSAQSGAPGGAQGVVQAPEQTQQRQIGVSLGFDDGDSVWLPQLAGGPSQQLRVSQQEVMSPPKEDTPVMPCVHPGKTPLQSLLPLDQATLAAHEPSQCDMGEPTLAEALTAADLPRSQHDDSDNLDQPAQMLPGQAERQPGYPPSIESMAAVRPRSLANEDEEDSLPVARARRKTAHVLEDTLTPSQPLNGQEAAEHPASSDSVEAQAAAQPDPATEPGLAATEATMQQPAGVQNADVAPGALPDTLQQLGLDSPGLPDEAGGHSGAEGQDQAAAGEPKQAPATGSEAQRPSTQEPDQAAPAVTPFTSPDGWRSKQKPGGTGASPAAKPEGLDLHSNAPERINREGTPVALGVEGQVVQVPQQGSRRQFIQEDSDEAHTLERGSWRVKHHTQAQPEALPPSPEQQPDLAPPPQAHAAPMEQQLDVATKQQPDLVPAAQDAPVEPHQPDVPPETQGVTSGQMFAALANVGNLADMYPDSQAELARQAPACEADLVLPTKPPVKDKTQGEPQAGARVAEGVQQPSSEDLLHKVGGPLAANNGEALPLHPAKTAADEPEARAGRAKGRARASGESAAAKGSMGKAGTAASSGEAGIKAATEAASAQPGKQLTGGSATAAAQGVHSDYSFPAHTEPAENPSVRFVRAAATASRLASAPAAQKESEEAADEVPESMAGPRKGAGRGKTAAEKRYKSKAAAPQVSKKRESRAAGKAMEAEGDPGLEQPNEAAEEMPRKAARQGRKTAKTDQPEPEGAPVPARPIRGRTTPAAAEEDAVNEANATTAAEPDQDAEKADVQEEMGTEDPPKSVSAGPAKGKKIPAPAGESKAGEKGKGGAGKGKEAARTDATAEMEVPQARYRLSRTTRAAQTTAESSGQADAGTATAPQQAKRSKVNVRVAAPEGLVKGAESEVADASAKRSAGLTESQAAADTLAKVRSGRHFSALQEDTEAPGQKQPLRRYAAPAKRGRRSQQAVSAQEPEEKGDEQPEEQEEILAKRARRSAPANIPRESSAAKPEQEQLPAAKKTKRASRAAISDADAGELGGKQQPAALSGKRASRADVPQESPVEPEEATALQSKRGKCARSTKTSREEPEQAQPQAAKRTAAQPAQEHLQPAPGLAEEPEPSAMGGRRATRLGGAASQAQTPDRQLRASATRPVKVLISSCVDAKLRKSMTKTIKRLGAVLTTSPKDFTVFVTLEAAKGQKERGFIKSLNTLSALASGAPIVSEKWVDGSSRSGAFLDARDHLLQDAAAEAKFGFNLAHAWKAAQQGLLLDNTAVFLTPGLTAAESDKGEGLCMLIARAGGSVARTVAELDTCGTSQGVILGNEKDVGKERTWAKKSCKGTFPVIGRSEFVSALLQQRLEPASSALFIT